MTHSSKIKGLLALGIISLLGVSNGFAQAQGNQQNIWQNIKAHMQLKEHGHALKWATQLPSQEHQKQGLRFIIQDMINQALYSQAYQTIALISDSTLKTQLLKYMLNTLLERKQFHLAQSIVGQFPPNHHKDQALSNIAKAYLDIKQDSKAIEIYRTIQTPIYRQQLIFHFVQTYIKRGSLYEAQKAAAQLTDPQLKALAHRALSSKQK